MQPCPKCEGKGWVLETRRHLSGARRRYECQACQFRWNTIEIPADRVHSKGVLLLTDKQRAHKALDKIGEALDALRAQMNHHEDD